MTIERYRPDWVPAMVALWNAEIGADFPMTERLFRQNVPDSPGFQPEDVFLIAEGEALLGFVVARPGRQFEPSLWFTPADGWINSIVVASARRRQGIGTILLGHAEAYLREQGSQRVVLGGDLGHFFPGIPVELDAAKAFAKARGYQFGGLGHDLWRNLDDYQTPDSVRQQLARETPGAEVRPGTREDMPALARFLSDEFPGRWRWISLQFLASGGGPEEFTLLLVDGHVAGFCQTFTSRSALLGPSVMWHPLLGERYGGLGPMGVATSLRGRGLGIALLCGAVEDLKRRGVQRMAIDWTGLTGFYGKIGFTIWKSYQHAVKGL